MSDTGISAAYLDSMGPSRVETLLGNPDRFTAADRRRMHELVQHDPVFASPEWAAVREELNCP